MRETIAYMTDMLREEADGLAEEWPSGVKLFDELSWQQRLALLARVANALLKPEISAPRLSAVNEATVAAIFAGLHCNVVIELDEANENDLPSEYDNCFWRRLIAACQEPASSQDDFFIDETCNELADWETLMECLADQILWDDDWSMPELFLDAKPEDSSIRRQRLGIERNYFIIPAPDPRDDEMASILNGLQKLLRTGD